MRNYDDIEHNEQADIETVKNATENTTEVENFVTGHVASCSQLNVRSEPSVKAEVLHMIPCGTEVLVDLIKSTEDFYAIYTASGLTGFCMKTYIELGE